MVCVLKDGSHLRRQNLTPMSVLLWCAGYCRVNMICGATSGRKNEHQNSPGWRFGDQQIKDQIWCSPVRSRKTCASKFYGVRAQGWVTPAKAKSDIYVCIVVVGGVLLRQDEMRLLLFRVKAGPQTTSSTPTLLSPLGGL